MRPKVNENVQKVHFLESKRPKRDSLDIFIAFWDHLAGGSKWLFADFEMHSGGLGYLGSVAGWGYCKACVFMCVCAFMLASAHLREAQRACGKASTEESGWEDLPGTSGQQSPEGAAVSKYPSVEEVLTYALCCHIACDLPSDYFSRYPPLVPVKIRYELIRCSIFNTAGSSGSNQGGPSLAEICGNFEKRQFRGEFSNFRQIFGKFGST